MNTVNPNNSRNISSIIRRVSPILLSCYLGKLYILDKTRKEIIVYADE